MAKPAVLLLARLPEALGARLCARFDCHERAQLDAASLQALAPLLRGIVATGESVVPRELIARLPALEIISVLGVGYDGIDMAAARERGICVTHTPGLSTEDIADFAMALVAALRERRILAAGLDVFCNEPRVPEELLGLDNVVLTPHMASTTGATVQAMLDLTFANLAAHFDGLAVPTPVA